LSLLIFKFLVYCLVLIRFFIRLNKLKNLSRRTNAPISLWADQRPVVTGTNAPKLRLRNV